ncbi:unnamed protein product [Cyprideis torosa]|uniref:GDT1 family protein n=1 Tax=Cyprideis torosa TaxID=163714 RepID=A0A7R8W792_9CRUS|nr:unnamed protein product [Cyprideis torosa]CAG0887349.1 unnamed protein product [Cyprideis torosa]
MDMFQPDEVLHPPEMPSGEHGNITMLNGTAGNEGGVGGLVEAGFLHAFLAAFGVIIVTELGDKTFFISCIMAMKYNRFVVFGGTMAAMFTMTILSVLLGAAVSIVPREYVHYGSTALFVIFGLKMLRDGYKMKPEEGQEEFNEVDSELKRRDEELDVETQAQGQGTVDVEAAASEEERKRQQEEAKRKKERWLLYKVFLQAFTLCFLAEWGDRSQFATIILAARQDKYGVTIGATTGHAVCTLIAVIGGRLLAMKLSVKTVTIIGGVVFLIFAVIALIMGPST